MDFIYFKDDLESQKQEKISSSNFKNLKNITHQRFNFVAVDALHASDATLIEDSSKPIYDLAIVPKKCIIPTDCDQPTYKHILQMISDCDSSTDLCDQNSYSKILSELHDSQTSSETNEKIEKQNKIITDQLQGFFVEMNLKLPEEFEFPKGFDLKDNNLFKYIKFDFENNIFLKDQVQVTEWLSNLATQQTWEGTASTNYPDIAKIQIGRGTQFESRKISVLKDSEGSPKEIRLGLSGRFIPSQHLNMSIEEQKNKFTEAIQSLTMSATAQIEFPGLKSRTVEIVIKPTQSTYIELNMQSR